MRQNILFVFNMSLTRQAWAWIKCEGNPSDKREISAAPMDRRRALSKTAHYSTQQCAATIAGLCSNTLL